MLDEFYRVAFRKKLYASIEDLQNDLDLWIKTYNEERPHQGRWCFGKTPMQTFLDAIPIVKEKMIAASHRLQRKIPTGFMPSISARGKAIAIKPTIG
jgi:Integrase core domain